jgi:hypothetical protein
MRVRNAPTSPSKRPATSCTSSTRAIFPFLFLCACLLGSNFYPGASQAIFAALRGLNFECCPSSSIVSEPRHQALPCACALPCALPKTGLSSSSTVAQLGSRPL